MYSVLRRLAVLIGAPLLFTVVGCSGSGPAAPAPVGSTASGPALGPDNSTLKATAPTQISPGIDEQVQSQRPTLQVQPATGRFVPQTFSYEFEVLSTGGASVARQTVQDTSWTVTTDLQSNTTYQWRARAVLNTAVGPWSSTRSFRTFVLPGCINGLLSDPKAYFFFLVGSSEGAPAGNWEATLLNTGIPAGLGPGQKAGPTRYGFTQQIERANNAPRGRLFLPTETADPLGYYTRPINVVLNGRWAWQDVGGPAYVPRRCPDPAALR